MLKTDHCYNEFKYMINQLENLSLVITKKFGISI